RVGRHLGRRGRSHEWAWLDGAARRQRRPRRGGLSARAEGRAVALSEVYAELYGTSSDCTTPIRLCGTSMFDVAVGTSDQTSATQTSRSTTIARIRRFS